MARVLEVTYRRSVIGCPQNQRKTVHALGLRRLHQKVHVPDNPSVRGMLRTVQHLVTWDEIDEVEKQ